MSEISIQNLVKTFSVPDGELTAVNDVSLEIKDGEFLVLVGPSGSGKSTILRMLAGLESVTEGTINLGDKDITTDKPKNRDIAMVFQNYALYPHLTARENMSFGLRMRGEISDEEIKENVENAASTMGIYDLLEKMPGDLSGGQKQRVALGRAIVRDPQAFLMDEPLSNLDAKLRTTMRTEIQRLQDKLGVTTIYVTHDQTEAMTMGDRIAIMNDGKLQQVATPMEAYYQPTNQFVAGFIGSPSMNFVDMRVSQSDKKTLEHNEFTYPITERIRESIGDGAEDVILGIRPEDLEVSREQTDTSFEVEIDVVEPLGKEQIIYFTLDNVTYKGSVSGQLNISKGETIHLDIPPERIHLFENGSGEALLNCVMPEEKEEEEHVYISDRETEAMT